MRILLTGSSGWLGRFLAPKLRSFGHIVIGLDPAPGQYTQIIGTIANANLVERVFDDHEIDAVIHCGALHKPDIARFSTQDFIDTNVTGTLNLLRAACRRGHKQFVMTSTTSLMITKEIHTGDTPDAVWLDEQTGPLEPRNIYGVTKLSAEGLCRLHHLEHGLNCIILRTSRFFPEDDDTQRVPSGLNLKTNELLYRRLSVDDAVDAHICALEKARDLGFGVFVISASPPFDRSDAMWLKTDAAQVIAGYFPDAAALYAKRGWQLPKSIGRVYDPSLAQTRLGFRCRVDFAAALDALRAGMDPPIVHDADYISPSITIAAS
jgi:nucleoside-diphosphate-sugar epimerase